MLLVLPKFDIYSLIVDGMRLERYRGGTVRENGCEVL